MSNGFMIALFLLLAAFAGHLQYQISAINSALESLTGINVIARQSLRSEQSIQQSPYVSVDYNEEAGMLERVSEQLRRESDQALTGEPQTRDSTPFLDVDSLPLTPYSDGPVQIGEFSSPDDVIDYMIDVEAPRSIGAFVDPDAPQ